MAFALSLKKQETSIVRFRNFRLGDKVTVGMEHPGLFLVVTIREEIAIGLKHGGTPSRKGPGVSTAMVAPLSFSGFFH